MTSTTTSTSCSGSLKLRQNGNFCYWSQNYKISNSRFSDLTVTPSTAQIVSVAGSLQLSCAMNLDATYSTRAVTWKLNSGADVSFSLFMLKITTSFLAEPES